MIAERFAFAIDRTHETLGSQNRIETCDIFSTTPFGSSRTVVAGATPVDLCFDIRIQTHIQYLCTARMETFELATHLYDLTWLNS